MSTSITTTSSNTPPTISTDKARELSTHDVPDGSTHKATEIHVDHVPDVSRKSRVPTTATHLAEPAAGGPHPCVDSKARTSMGACRSCGAYGGSQHRPTCQPGRVFKLGPSRLAARDRRLSALVLAHMEYDEFLIRNL